MSNKYARGERAWGICGRSGIKMLLREMVFDGRYPNMRVHPDWYEGKHPQEYLPKVEDPIALWRPSPEVIAMPSAPSLQVTLIGGTTPQLVFSSAVNNITEMETYQVWRITDGNTLGLLADCVVNRDFLGGILSVDHCTISPAPPEPNVPLARLAKNPVMTFLDDTATLGHIYCYYVTAIPMGNNISNNCGPPAMSETMCVDLSGSNKRLLENGGFRLLETGDFRLLES